MSYDYRRKRGLHHSTAAVEDAIVQQCRKGFKNRWSDMWIKPVYFEDRYLRYTSDFFSEVGVELYPKITEVPRCRPKGYTEDEWRSYIWSVAHDDIRTNIAKGVNPVNVVVRGVRIPDRSVLGGYRQDITSVMRVRRLAMT